MLFRISMVCGQMLGVVGLLAGLLLLAGLAWTLLGGGVLLLLACTAMEAQEARSGPPERRDGTTAGGPV